MSMLSNLQKPKSFSKRKRVGRGSGSGWGTTAARGYKGQKARSGGGVSSTFEGGQMPIWQRLPKFGFTNVFKKKFNIVNLSDLEEFDREVTPDLLAEANLIDKRLPTKVLANGVIKKALDIKAHKFSKSAKQKIEKVGGKWTELEFKKAKDVAKR